MLRGKEKVAPMVGAAADDDEAETHPVAGISRGVLGDGIKKKQKNNTFLGMRWQCWCRWVLLLLASSLPRSVLSDDAGSNVFDANSATFVAEQVSKLMEAAWDQVYTLTSAFDSGMLASGTLMESKKSGHRGSHVNSLVDDNATRQFLWTNYKRTTLGADYLYIGFENSKFICYARDNFYSDRKFYSYMPDINETCIANFPRGGDGSTVQRCLTDYCSQHGPRYGIDNITGAPKLGTNMVEFDCTGRPWYKTAQASRIGQAWTEVYVFVGACSPIGKVLGITGSAVVHNVDGVLLGVAAVDYQLISIESVLANHLSGLPNAVAFIVDNAEEKLVAASIPNITIGYDASSGEAFQVKANETSTCDVVPQPTDATYIECRSRASILRAARKLTGEYRSQDGELFLMNDVDGYSGYFWVRSQEISDAYGLTWHLVFIERVTCSANFFLDKSTEACQPCVNNEASEEGNNEDECSGCVEHYYRKTYHGDMQRSGECLQCPTGATCPGGTELPRAEKGYYQFPDVAIVYPCRVRMKHSNVKSTCEGWIVKPNSTLGNMKCQEGSEGLLCSSCQEDYFFSEASVSCEKCEKETDEDTFFYAIVISAVLVFLIGFVYKTEENQNFHGTFCSRTRLGRIVPLDDGIEEPRLGLCGLRICRCMVKIKKRFFAMTTGQIAGWKSFLTALQIIHSTTQTIPEIEFPGFFVHTRAAMGYISFSIWDFHDVLVCRLQLSYFHQVLTTTLLPIIIFVLIYLIYLLRLYYRIYCTVKKPKSTKQPDTNASQPRSAPSDLPPPEDSDRGDDGPDVTPEAEQPRYWRHFGKPFVQYTLLVAYFSLPAVSRATFSVFNCETFQTGWEEWEGVKTKPKREDFLEADLTVKCHDSDHKKMQDLAWAFMFSPWGGPIATVLVTFCVLFWYRKKIRCPKGAETSDEGDIVHRRQKVKEIQYFAFLYSAYQPIFWWFEVYETLRRIALTGGILLIKDLGDRLFYAQMLALMSMIIHDSTNPFLGDGISTTNFCTNLTHSAVFLVFFSAERIRNGPNNEDDVEGVVWWEIMMEVVVPLAIVIFVLVFFQGPLEQRRLVHGAEKRAERRDLHLWIRGKLQEEGLEGNRNDAADTTAHLRFCGDCGTDFLNDIKSVLGTFWNSLKELFRCCADEDQDNKVWVMRIADLDPELYCKDMHEKARGKGLLKELTIAKEIVDEQNANSFVISHTCNCDAPDEMQKMLEFLQKRLPEIMNLEKENTWIWMDCFSIPPQPEPRLETATSELNEPDLDATAASTANESALSEGGEKTDDDPESMTPEDNPDPNATAASAANESASLVGGFYNSDQSAFPGRTRKYFRNAIRACSRIVPLVERKQHSPQESPDVDMVNQTNQKAEEAWLNKSPWAKLDILQALCPKMYKESRHWKPGPKGQRFYFYDDASDDDKFELGSVQGSVLTVSHLRDPTGGEEDRQEQAGLLEVPKFLLGVLPDEDEETFSAESPPSDSNPGETNVETVIKNEVKQLKWYFKKYQQSGSEAWNLTLLRSKQNESHGGCGKTAEC